MFPKKSKLINSKYNKEKPFICITQKIILNPTTSVVKVIKQKNKNMNSTRSSIYLNNKKNRSVSPKIEINFWKSFDKNENKSISKNIINSSSKIKDDYLNQYSNLTNKINNINKRKDEMNKKLTAFKKKDKEIKKIQKSKSELKIKILEAKKKNEEELKEKKNKIQSMRKLEKERNKSLQEIKSQKSHLLSEITKYDHNLIKSMINHSNYQNDTINKYKYLKLRDEKKNKNKIKIKKKEDKKFNDKIFNKRLEEINNLKLKCDELEKIKVRCIEDYNNTKKKVLSMNKSLNIIITEKQQKPLYNSINNTPINNKSNLSILTLSESYSTNSGQIKSLNFK